VTVEIEPDRIAIPDEPSQRDPIEETNGIFESLVAQGLRARIASGNLLLGQRVVELALSRMPRRRGSSLQSRILSCRQ
jgi:hypothetical protein